MDREKLKYITQPEDPKGSKADKKDKTRVQIKRKRIRSFPSNSEKSTHTLENSKTDKKDKTTTTVRIKTRNVKKFPSESETSKKSKTTVRITSKKPKQFIRKSEKDIAILKGNGVSKEEENIVNNVLDNLKEPIAESEEGVPALEEAPYTILDEEPSSPTEMSDEGVTPVEGQKVLPQHEEQKAIPEKIDIPLPEESESYKDDEKNKINKTEAPPSPPPRKEPKREKITIVEASDAIESGAQDTAEARMTASKEELKRVKGFVKKIWKHNLLHSYYHNKELAKARKEIEDTGNIYAGEGADKEAHKEAMKAIVDRFSSDYEETVHRNAGEEIKKLEEESFENDDGEQEGIKTSIRKLIMDYAAGDIKDEEEFTEEKKRIFGGLQKSQSDIIEKGLLYADNLFEIADNVKERVKEGEALKNIDLDFEVVIGKAKTGVRTEAQFNTADRIAEKISKSKVGQFVNETTVASGVSLAYSLISASSKRVARSKLMAWGSFGGTALLAGGIAGFRENKRFKEERRQHLREMAQNKEFDKKESPRRNEMEEYRYETKNAEVMTSYLRQRLYIEGTEEIRDDLSEDDVENTLGALAQIESRVRLSDNKNIDLISYSDITKVEQERRMLDSTVGAIKDNLRKKDK